MHNQTNVPAAAGVNTDIRVIVGVQLRCVDGRWTDRDGVEMAGTKLLALGTLNILQRWENDRVVDVKDPHAFDLEELNAAVPPAQWEAGINGPRPPWVRTYVTYLLDPENGERYTHANSTTGARIATEDLADKIRWMRRIRGSQVVPVVELSNKLMKTKFGQKLRPHFKVLGWQDLGGALAAQPATPMLGGPVQEVDPVTSEEVLNDSIGF
jgi:hypothetical protein